MENKNIKIEDEKEKELAKQEIYALERQSELLDTVHPAYKMSLLTMLVVGLFLIILGQENYSLVGIGLLVIVVLITLLLRQVRRQNQTIIEKNKKEIEDINTAIKEFDKENIK